MQNAANSARPYYQTAADAVTGAANTVADSYATRAQNQVDASYGINCAIGSTGYGVTSIALGPASIAAANPVSAGLSAAGSVAGALGFLMASHEANGNCD